jgi:hypothetical protein
MDAVRPTRAGIGADKDAIGHGREL